MRTDQYRLTGLRLLYILCISACLQLSGCANQPANIGFGNTISEKTPEGKLRLAILRTAQGMLGTPYHYGGATPRGFDCSGLVFYSYRMAGIKIPRTAYAQYKKIKPRSPDKLLPGDVLFFRIDGDTSHVGIYQGNDTFIHAPATGKHVTRDSINSRYWKAHFVRGGRLI